jgi:predicted homoserine dehydrogenase-like protein
VDYVVGAKPSPGVFVFADHEDPKLRHYLNYGKLGDGPLYSFYVPYHLTVFEVPISVARVALFRDTVIAPLAGPVVEVVATAKVDLEAGQTLDGLGHYMTYGQCENADVAREQRLLPMGVAEGCRLKRDIAQDEVLTVDDVDVPPGRLCDRLRAEQSAYFAERLAPVSR